MGILKLLNSVEDYYLLSFAAEKEKDSLIKKYPQYKDDIFRFHAKYIMWLYKRFGENPTAKETHLFL